MRVTKLIRGYVEKKVKDGLPFGAPIEEFNAAKENLRDTTSEIEQKARSYILQLCDEANAGLPEGFKIAISAYRLVDYTWYNSPLERAASKHEREVCQKRKTAVESILLNLELGATKAELEQLISDAIS